MHWTNEILQETQRNLVSLRFTTEAQATRMIAAMQTFFDDAAVTDYEQFIPEMTNDPKDRHVVAAAWSVGAEQIVTFNVRDFHPDDLAPFNLRAVSPDAFLIQLFETAPDVMATIIREQEQDRVRPAKSVAELLDGLAKLVPHFVIAMKEHMAL